MEQQTSEQIARACRAYELADRDVTISVLSTGQIQVGIYWTATGQRISGTTFQSWPSVLKLLARLDAGYTYLLFVRPSL